MKRRERRGEREGRRKQCRHGKNMKTQGTGRGKQDPQTGCDRSASLADGGVTEERELSVHLKATGEQAEEGKWAMRQLELPLCCWRQ